MSAKKLRSKSGTAYRKIRAIDGRHPFAETVPGGSIAYRVRQRHHGKVTYFNFGLAKEMGIIPSNHPHKLDDKLQSALLDTFAIQIINEYDLIHNTKIPEADIKPYTYMATRYLQLQHNDKRGLRSGDGRSIWNGYVEHRGIGWDISSCGTGATCLSPASANQEKFFQSGDPTVSYGCGYSEVMEGLTDSIFSEIMHRNQVRTERSLAVIEFPKGFSVNVRAGKNLLRPSHFFNHLKQGNLERVKAVTDYYIDRQVQNGDFSPKRTRKARYDYFLEKMTETFATITAQFENEYIFCWMDWDGDNILADGGIIDYGSIRQFGLYHHEYRFDDVERWSTTIPEQKSKAKYAVQAFAQLVDFIKTGKRKQLEKFKNHKSLKEFDKIFAREKQAGLLKRLGLETRDIANMLNNQPDLVDQFARCFAHFERATSKEGLVRIEDGMTRNAIFCMRDILRVLPQKLLDDEEPFDTEEFIQILRSNYALPEDLEISTHRHRMAQHFQSLYDDIINTVSDFTKESKTRTLQRINKRSKIINRADRVTGDSIIHCATKARKSRNKLSQNDLQALIEQFIIQNTLDPDNAVKSHLRMRSTTATRPIARAMQRLVNLYREGL